MARSTSSSSSEDEKEKEKRKHKHKKHKHKEKEPKKKKEEKAAAAAAKTTTSGPQPKTLISFFSVQPGMAKAAKLTSPQTPSPAQKVLGECRKRETSMTRKIFSKKQQLTAALPDDDDAFFTVISDDEKKEEQERTTPPSPPSPLLPPPPQPSPPPLVAPTGFSFATSSKTAKNHKRLQKALEFTAAAKKSTTETISPMAPAAASPLTGEKQPKAQGQGQGLTWLQQLREYPPTEDSPSAEVQKKVQKKDSPKEKKKKRDRKPTEAAGDEKKKEEEKKIETPPKKKPKKVSGDDDDKDVEMVDKTEKAVAPVTMVAATTDVGDAAAPPSAEKKKPVWFYGKPDRSAINPHCKPLPKGHANCLAGFVFTVTGRLESLGREEAEELIRHWGGTVQQAAGKRVTHLLMGEGGGESKSKAARERGNITIVTEDELFELIKTLPPKPDSAVKKSPKKKKKATEKESAAVPMLPVSPTPDREATEMPSPAAVSSAPPKDLLWVDRYAPKTVSQMVLFSRDNVNKLASWLKGWADTGKAQPVGKSKITYQSVLLSGPPGVGKSTAAKLTCAECGFTPLELNASDVRSKKTIKECVEEALHNTSITQFFGASAATTGFSASRSGKTALIMDEVDGMSTGDRGGIAELIHLIKGSKVPIICICNDRSSTKVKSLAKSCLDLKFQKPMVEQVATRLADIARHERVQPFTLDNARSLATTADCDIR
jgi:replication factor C subunit 1